MGGKTKLCNRLDSLGFQFQEDLFDPLPDVLAGHDLLLLDASQYSVPAEFQQSDLSQADQLMSAANEIIRLRRPQCESVVAPPAQRLENACQENSDTPNHHRLGAQIRAESLLEHISAFWVQLTNSRHCP